MEFVADLHLHSKYSRAVSKNMTLDVMEKFARQKGINLLSAADWTHPLWQKALQSQLEEAGEGLYKLKVIKSSSYKVSESSSYKVGEREVLFTKIIKNVKLCLMLNKNYHGNY